MDGIRVAGLSMPPIPVTGRWVHDAPMPPIPMTGRWVHGAPVPPVSVDGIRMAGVPVVHRSRIRGRSAMSLGA